MKFGHQKAISKLSDLFIEHTYDVEKIDPNLRDLTYKAAILNNYSIKNHSNIITIMNTLRVGANNNEKTRILRALAYDKVPRFIIRLSISINNIK